MKVQRLLAIGFILMLVLSACTPFVTPTEEPATATAEPEPENVLNIYNWDTYMDPDVVANFEKEFGVRVNYETYADNEEMLATIQSGPVDYDLVIPSDYMVGFMRQENLLAPLNRENIPNFKNIAPDFLNQAFDPGNRYSVPYQWGTVGIAYNIKATGKEINSWSDFFDPAYAGRVSMLTSARETLGVVLLYLGYSPNTTDYDEIAAARDFLMDHADHIFAYAPDTGQDLLVAGEVDLAFEWSGDIFQIMEDNPDIRYVIPKEGSIVWADGMCILAGALHKDLAEKFINYVLEPENGAAISSYIRYSSPNQAALPLIDEADRNNPALYPSPEVRKRLFFLADPGPEASQLYEEAMAAVMEAHGR